MEARQLCIQTPVQDQLSEVQSAIPIPTTKITEKFTHTDTEPLSKSPATPSHTSLRTSLPLSPPSISNQLFIDLLIHQPLEPSISTHPMLTHNMLKQNPSRAAKLVKPTNLYAAIVSSTNTVLEPCTVKTAPKSPERFRAMQEEIIALHENATWVLVPRPNNDNVVGSKWVFRTKFKEDGSLDRYKVCLVAKEYMQVEGLDYEETFSPVIKPTTIRLILSLAISLNWVIKQLDVKNAFLHGDLKEMVYMEQPPGFVYLKIMGLVWQDFYLFSCYWFLCSKVDSSLFIYQAQTIVTLVLVYVDDVVIIGSIADFIHLVIQSLSTKFALKDLGRLWYFLGLEVNVFNGGLFLSQCKYNKDVLHKAQMLERPP